MIYRNTRFVSIIALLFVVFGVGVYTLAHTSKSPEAIYQTLIQLEYNYYDPTLVSQPKLLNIAIESIQDTLEAKGIIINFALISLQESDKEAWETFEKQWTDNIFKYETSDHQLEFIAIRAMLESFGNSHIYFIDPKSFAKRQEQLKKKAYSGVGITIIETEQEIFVFEVLPDSPAELAGIFPLDQIVAVDNQAVLSAKDAADKIRGPAGTTVTLTVYRNQQLHDITITRGIIQWPDLTTKLLYNNGKRILYVRLYTFNTYDNLSEKLAFEFALYAPIDGMIVDIRSNRGGFLENCNDLLDVFLPEGLDLYVTKSATQNQVFMTKARQVYAQPLIIMINQFSASGAEIFSGVLQEQGRAVIVGQQSAGGASIGRLFELMPYKAAIMIATRQFFTADGKKLEGIGVVPDIEVDRTKDDIIAAHDPQLEKAIEALLEQLY